VLYANESYGRNTGLTHELPVRDAGSGNNRGVTSRTSLTKACSSVHKAVAMKMPPIGNGTTSGAQEVNYLTSVRVFFFPQDRFPGLGPDRFWFPTIAT